MRKLRWLNGYMLGIKNYLRGKVRGRGDGDVVSIRTGNRAREVCYSDSEGFIQNDVGLGNTGALLRRTCIERRRETLNMEVNRGCGDVGKLRAIMDVG